MESRDFNYFIWYKIPLLNVSENLYRRQSMSNIYSGAYQMISNLYIAIYTYNAQNLYTIDALSAIFAILAIWHFEYFLKYLKISLTLLKLLTLFVEIITTVQDTIFLKVLPNENEVYCTNFIISIENGEMLWGQKTLKFND